jgi:hypothetical protein
MALAMIGHCRRSKEPAHHGGFCTDYFRQASSAGRAKENPSSVPFRGRSGHSPRETSAREIRISLALASSSAA